MERWYAIRIHNEHPTPSSRGFRHFGAHLCACLYHCAGARPSNGGAIQHWSSRYHAAQDAESDWIPQGVKQSLQGRS
jgi:hypothetical protein